MKTTTFDTIFEPWTRVWAALVFLTALAILSATPAAAQPSADAAPDVLTRTDEILQNIAPLIQESDSEQARRIFEDALHKQQQAHHFMSNDRPGFAITVSMRAREGGRQAERIARGSLNYEERVRNYLDRLIDFYEQVLDRAQETGNEQAMRFIREAEALYHRAREQYRQTHYQQAFTLLKSAETQLNRAARMLFETGDAERLEHELDRTSELIALAADRLDDVNDPALSDLLGRAEEALGRARRAMADQQPLMAMRFARQARDLAQRVLRQLGPAPDADGLTTQIERFDEQVSRVAEQITTSGDQDAQRFLGRARDMRDQAQDALNRGELERSLRQIRTALNMLRQAAERTP